MSEAPSHTPEQVGLLVLDAVETYTRNVFKDLDQLTSDYRTALESSQPARARSAYTMLGEVGSLASNLVNLLEHSLKKVEPEQVVSQVWGDIDVFLRYHVPEHHNEDDLPPLHTLLMDILNSVSFRVFGYGHVLLDGEPLPKLPEESDPRAQSRLTKDISSRVLAEFRDDVFATRRRVQRMEQRVTKPTAEGVGTEEDRALPLTLHPA
jgi:hypothetical protein